MAGAGLPPGYLAFYEERKGPHWKPRIEKVRKHSLRRCPWSPESPTQVSTHALSLQVWDSPESAGGLRSPGLHPCWLAGRLRACLPSFLPASPVSAPPPRTPGGHRGPLGLRSGCGQDSSLVPRAHCAPRAPACRGALHPPHGLLGVPGSPGVPEGWEAVARVPAVILAPPALDLQCRGCRGRGAPIRSHLSPPVPRASLNSQPLENSHLYPLHWLVFAQSCLTLCDPMDSARQTSLSFTISGCVWKSFSLVRLLATPWTVQSMEFSMPEYWRR